MMVILKQTVTYLETEDRLQLLSQCSDESVIALWLTRRLADRLVQAIFQGLEGSGGRSEALWREVALQEGIVSGDDASLNNPVPVAEELTQHLVLSIDIAPLPDGQQLTFHASECNASFMLREIPMFRWLGILHRWYLHAGWGTADIWPAWFEPEILGRDLDIPVGTVFH
ncbi:MAG: hypothetical protein KGI47_00050 [Betaproteobacteria bacterium]|nr:hypothetical protein [Betaproteobacteria bacterium]MDE2622009.1 hypothetical protein [Betaproteobacteria bacterium]